MKLTTMKDRLRRADYFPGEGVRFEMDDAYDTMGEDQDYTRSPDELAAARLAAKRRARARKPSAR